MTAANGFILLKKWNSLGRSFLFRDRIYRNYVWSFSLLHRLRRLSFPRDVPRDLWTNRSRTGGVIKYRQAYIVRNSERGACTWWLSSFYAVTAFTRWETTDGKRFQIVAANLSSPSQPMRMKVQWIFVFLLLVFLFFYILRNFVVAPMEIVSAFFDVVCSSYIFFHRHSEMFNSIRIGIGYCGICVNAPFFFRFCWSHMNKSQSTTDFSFYISMYKSSFGFCWTREKMMTLIRSRITTLFQNWKKNPFLSFERNAPSFCNQ